MLYFQTSSILDWFIWVGHLDWIGLMVWISGLDWFNGLDIWIGTWEDWKNIVEKKHDIMAQLLK